MRLSKALKEKELDLRLRDKHIVEGKLSKAEVDQYLANLPDDGNKLTTTERVGQAAQTAE